MFVTRPDILKLNYEKYAKYIINSREKWQIYLELSKIVYIYPPPYFWDIDASVIHKLEHIYYLY